MISGQYLQANNIDSLALLPVSIEVGVGHIRDIMRENAFYYTPMTLSL